MTSHIGSLDANLLAPLQALLELQHVSRAAERMHVSQSAMSATLARLRRHFDDELLIRSGSAYASTPLAGSLLPLVNSAVQAIESAFDARAGFEPRTSDRRFTIVASDYAAGVVNPPLRALLAETAPDVGVHFHSVPGSPVLDRMALEYDLIIAPGEYGLRGDFRPLFRDEFVCLLDVNHPAAAEPEMTIDQLSEIPHAAASFAANLSTGADRLLDQLGVRRRVAVVSDEWLSLPWLIRDTSLVALLPRRIASWWAARGDFVLREVPGHDRGEFIENVYWHPSRRGDDGLAWLRNQMVDAIAESDGEPSGTYVAASADGRTLRHPRRAERAPHGVRPLDDPADHGIAAGRDV
jgi:DNA-binding transcriptional LysR family regulator